MWELRVYYLVPWDKFEDPILHNESMILPFSSLALDWTDHDSWEIIGFAWDNFCFVYMCPIKEQNKGEKTHVLFCDLCSEG